MVTIFWCLFSPIVLLIGIPIAFLLSLKNIFAAGPFVPFREKFSPLFRLFFFGWASSTDDVYLLGSGLSRFIPSTALVVHLLLAACGFGFLYLSYIPAFLQDYLSLSGFPFLLAAASLVPMAFGKDFSSQRLYFLNTDYWPYLERLKAVSSRLRVTYEHESWFTSLSFGSSYVPVEVEHDNPDNIVDCVAFLIREDISVQDLSLLISILLNSFDNTATSQKIFKITQALISNVRPGFAVVCLGYSIGFALSEDDGRFALCAARNI